MMMMMIGGMGKEECMTGQEESEETGNYLYSN